MAHLPRPSCTMRSRLLSTIWTSQMIAPRKCWSLITPACWRITPSSQSNWVASRRIYRRYWIQLPKPSSFVSKQVREISPSRRDDERTVRMLMRGELVQVLIEFWIMECESKSKCVCVCVLWPGGHFQHFYSVILCVPFPTLSLVIVPFNCGNFLFTPITHRDCRQY